MDWLARHQTPDGYWAAEGNPEVRTTAWILLAFLSHGDTSQAGPHQETVSRAIAWLKQQQGGDGAIDAVATMALAEAVGMGEPDLKESAQKAVDDLVSRQNPGMGWGENMEATTEALMALKSARCAELQVPDEAFQGVSAFLEKVYSQNAETGKGTFGSGCSSTAMGVLGRQLMGESKGVEEGAATLMDRLPDPKEMDPGYWYYGTLALFQLGGDSWIKWNAPLKDALTDRQKSDGEDAGSWDGRAYSTAMATLCLEVYDRYRKSMGIHKPAELTPVREHSPGELSPVP